VHAVTHDVEAALDGDALLLVEAGVSSSMVSAIRQSR